MHLFCVYTRVCMCKRMHTYMSLCVCACLCSWGQEEGVEYHSIVLLFHQGGVALNLQVEFSQAGRKSASPSGPPVFTLFGARVLGVCEMPDPLHGFWASNSDPHVAQVFFLDEHSFLLPLEIALMVLNQHRKISVAFLTF